MNAVIEVDGEKLLVDVGSDPLPWRRAGREVTGASQMVNGWLSVFAWLTACGALAGSTAARRASALIIDLTGAGEGIRNPRPQPSGPFGDQRRAFFADHDRRCVRTRIERRRHDRGIDDAEVIDAIDT